MGVNVFHLNTSFQTASEYGRLGLSEMRGKRAPSVTPVISSWIFFDISGKSSNALINAMTAADVVSEPAKINISRYREKLAEVTEI